MKVYIFEQQIEKQLSSKILFKVQIFGLNLTIEINDFSCHISSTEMIILPLVGFYFMKVLIGYCKNKLAFLYYAHMGLWN